MVPLENKNAWYWIGYKSVKKWVFYAIIYFVTNILTIAFYVIWAEIHPTYLLMLYDVWN